MSMEIHSALDLPTRLENMLNLEMSPETSSKPMRLNSKRLLKEEPKRAKGN